MGLTRLEIKNIRNLHSVSIEPGPGLNGLYGLNGSGKTSFLEALYILGRGSSFRSKDLSRVLQDGAQQFFISGKLSPQNISIGVEYQAQGLRFRVDGQTVQSRLELAGQLPLLFISPESHALVSEGPRQRRRFLDWGVFHVEPGFMPAWRRYQRALKQRNRALGMSGVETAWDQELARAAEEITRLRRDYLERLTPFVDRYVRRLVDLDPVTLGFASGWRQGCDFMEVLQDSLPQDREYGFTRQGPHRADVILKVGHRPARDTISRGQQKLLIIALLLSQVALMNEAMLPGPVILVDDLAAELDIHHRHRLLAVLSELQAQVYLTVTERQALPTSEEIAVRWFHVEQGGIMPG